MPARYADKLQGRRVLIFGSTSGIGFALAEACLEFGASIYITGSNPSKLEAALKKLKDEFPDSALKVHGSILDLSKGATLEADLNTLLLECTDNKKKPLHHVAYLSGSDFSNVNLDNVTIESIEAYSHVRRGAPILLAKLLKPGGFMSREIPAEASLTLTAGTLMHKAFPGYSVNMSLFLNYKAALKSLSIDLAPYIRVNYVSPGTIDTELLRRAMGNDEKVLEMCKNGTLTKTFPGPEEAVEGYLFLMRARYITAEEILIDGGRILA